MAPETRGRTLESGREEEILRRGRALVRVPKTGGHARGHVSLGRDAEALEHGCEGNKKNARIF